MTAKEGNRNFTVLHYTRCKIIIKKPIFSRLMAAHKKYFLRRDVQPDMYECSSFLYIVPSLFRRCCISIKPIKKQVSTFSSVNVLVQKACMYRMWMLVGRIGLRYLEALYGKHNYGALPSPSSGFQRTVNLIRVLWALKESQIFQGPLKIEGAVGCSLLSLVNG